MLPKASAIGSENVVNRQRSIAKAGGRLKVTRSNDDKLVRRRNPPASALQQIPTKHRRHGHKPNADRDAFDTQGVEC